MMRQENRISNARPEKDQSRKSEGVTGHALPALRLPDSASRNSTPDLRSSKVPEMRSELHEGRIPVFHSNRTIFLSVGQIISRMDA
jgi:hypothetical protein